MSKIAVIAISIVVLVLSGVLFYYASNMAADIQPDSYNARKEDLYLSQQKIQESITELNQTIAQQEETQKLLTEKVSELALKANSSPPVINTTKYVQEPPKIVTVPVSRAS